MNNNYALEGIKVLDFTSNTAGPSCGMLLAERGASVVHVEKPVLGDDCRRFNPLIGTTSFNYLWANKGKKSLVLNLKDESDKQVLLNRVKEADIFLESNRPGVCKRLGIDYESLRKIKPDLIYCSISLYGQKGPYAQKPGYDIIAQACSGAMYKTGYPDRSPMKFGVSISDFFGGINAFGHIMLALYQKERTGEGANIDISLARGMMWTNEFYDNEITGRVPKRTGAMDEKLCPYGVFSCKNGDAVVIGAASANTWAALCNAMERPELADDERYNSNAKRNNRQQEIQELIEGWLSRFDGADEACSILEKAGVPNSKAVCSVDIPKDEHVKSVGWIKRIKPSSEVPDGTPDIQMAVGLADVSSCPIKPGESIALGQHTEELKAKYK